MTTFRAYHGPALASVLVMALWALPACAQAEPEPTPPLARAFNESGHELLRALSKQPGNIVISPYSIGSAMAMVLSGARGETQAEMHKALRHIAPAAEVDSAQAQARDRLAGYDGSAARLRVAKALMLVNAAATVTPEFQQAMRDSYGAETFRGADLATANGWVKDKTEGKIGTILERLNPNDSHVLLNAVYFNAPWAQAFPKTATHDRPFTLTGGEDIGVPTMTLQSDFAVAAGEGFAAIRLPYAADGLSMIVVRPDDTNSVDKLIAAFDGSRLDALLQTLRTTAKRKVALAMPRFKTEFSADLVAPFKSLGMGAVFDPAQADLSGMTGLPRAQAQSSLDQIAHRAMIDVSEEGTEAAAATAAVVTTRTMTLGGPEPFQVDRPFLFMIADDRTGAVLFAGRIVDPRK